MRPCAPLVEANILPRLKYAKRYIYIYIHWATAMAWLWSSHRWDSPHSMTIDAANARQDIYRYRSAIFGWWYFMHKRAGAQTRCMGDKGAVGNHSRIRPPRVYHKQFYCVDCFFFVALFYRHRLRRDVCTRGNASTRLWTIIDVQ